MTIGASSRRRRVAALFGAVATAAAVAGCGSSPATVRPARSSSVSGNGFTVKLVVATTTVPAGGSIPATLEIVNHSKHPIFYPSCSVNATLEVGIGNAAIPFRPASGAVACSTVLHPGANVFPETISTSYQGCGGTGLPPCGSPPTAAPLPPGRYKTAIVWLGAPPQLPHPSSLAIRLTPSIEGFVFGREEPCGMALRYETVFVRQGAVTVATLSVVAGHYRIPLQPGTYELSTAPRSDRGPGVTVTVRARRTTTAPTLDNACK